MVHRVYQELLPSLLVRLSPSDNPEQRKAELLQLVRTHKAKFLYDIRTTTLDIVLKRKSGVSKSIHVDDRVYWNDKMKDASQRFHCITLETFTRVSSNDKIGAEDSQVMQVSKLRISDRVERILMITVLVYRIG